MTIHSTVKETASNRKLQGAAERLDEIGDFIVGVGGIQRGDLVVEVIADNYQFTKRLRQLGAHVLKVNWPSGSPQPLPMKPGSVDVIFANMVLRHMRFPTQAIAEMKQALKPGGRLVMTDFEKYHDVGLKADPKDRWMGFYFSDIRHWFCKTGFSNIIVNPVPYQMLGFERKGLGKSNGAGIFLATGTA